MELKDKKYDKQMVSVDICIFSIIDDELKILLVKRSKEPFLNFWSLLGGGVYNTESCEDAILREMKEKIGLEKLEPILAGVFSNPKRDIRFRNISISYYSLVNLENFKAKINSEKIKDIKWRSVNYISKLAFDHNEILENSIRLLRERCFDISFIKQYV